MSAPRRLSRDAAPRPVRVVHLGLGAFHRAHQAWYTQRAGDGWGIAAYTGRRPGAADALAAQDGLYTVVTRDGDGDRAEVVTALSRAHDGADTDRWTTDLADPEVGTLTLTITEAGYRAEPEDPHGAPGRIARGLLARLRADAGPINVLSCDNLPDNGVRTRAVVLAAVRMADPGAADRVDALAWFGTTVVDRITPATTEPDRRAAARLTGFADRCPVVTEPFHEWIIGAGARAPAPDWASAGARLVTDVTPFGHRKLWLLNGAHSLLAYAGPPRGHRTVAQAVGDPWLREQLDSLWDAAAALLPMDVTGYRAALLARFGNARIEHRLAQIAADGSQKIPARVLPVLRARLDGGHPPSRGQVTVLAAWLAHLRGGTGPVRDSMARTWPAELGGTPRTATTALLLRVAPDLADHGGLVRVVAARCAELERSAHPPRPHPP